MDKVDFIGRNKRNGMICLALWFWICAITGVVGIAQTKSPSKTKSPSNRMADPKVQINGSLLEISAEEREPQSRVVAARFRFEIKNVGKEPVIFLKDFLQMQSVSIAVLRKDGVDVVATYDYPPSFSNSKVWAEMAEDLLRKGPDSEYLRQLNSGESIFLERTERVFLDLSNHNIRKMLDTRANTAVVFRFKIWNDEILMGKLDDDFPALLARKWGALRNLYTSQIRAGPIAINF